MSLTKPALPALLRLSAFFVFLFAAACSFGQVKVNYAYGKPSPGDRTQGLSGTPADFTLDSAVVTYSFRKTTNALGFKVKEKKKYSVLRIGEEQVYVATEMLGGHTRLDGVDGQLKSPYGDRMEELDPEIRPYELEGIFHSDYSTATYSLFFMKGTNALKCNVYKSTDDIRYLAVNYFQEPYPVNYKEIRFVVPEWLEMDLVPVNFEGWDIQISESSEGNKSVVSFIAKDIPALGLPRGSLGSRRSYPHLLLLPRSFEMGDKRLPLFGDLGDMYTWYLSLVGDLPEIDPDVQATVARLIKGLNSDREKAEAIFYWVQDHIRYIAFEDGIAGFKPDAAVNVHQKLYGDCKGMANLTREMLNEAGIDARLTWLGTYEIPYDYSTPCLSVDNHMICTAYLDGQPLFLDPTEKFSGMGEYASRIQGKQVLIQNGEDYILDTIPVSMTGNTATFRHRYRIEGDYLLGTTSMILKGEQKTYLLQALDHVEPEEQPQTFKESTFYADTDTRFLNFEVLGLTDRGGNLEFRLECQIDNALSRFGDEIYFSFDQRELFEGSLIPADRKHAFDFGKNYVLRSDTEFEIPAGYRIKSRPQDFKRKFEGIEMDFGMHVSDNTLHYRGFVSISKRVLEPAQFDAWNDAIQDLSNLYNSQIVLEKL